MIGDENRLNGLFEEHRGRGYEKLLMFPLMVQLVGDALLQHCGRGYRVFSRAHEEGALNASIEAVYGKLARLNIDLSIALLCELTDPLRELFPTAARRKPPKSLREFATVILDGKAIKRVYNPACPPENPRDLEDTPGLGRMSADVHRRLCGSVLYNNCSPTK